VNNNHLKWLRFTGNECPLGPLAYVYVIYAGSKVPVGPLPARALIWSKDTRARKIWKYAEVREIVHTVANA
jgi:hypothetical protein